jgi:TP901 family phage tail tape measure protein
MAVGVNIVSTFDSKGISRAIKDFQKLGAAGASSGTKATFALRTLDSAAKNMVKSLAKVGAGVAVFGGLAVKSFASFDDAMTQSTAIMGNLSDDMKTKMSDAAREMARTTTFSATEAAKSFYFLASAGLDAESSIMALPKVAKFAQAGMFDMALATDLLTDAQSALGLTIRNDAVANMNNMVRVSDVLVKANTLANASVEQFSSALTNKAGAAMKAVGMDIEEGVAVLAAFADQGIKSEEAGTQFGIVLRDLQTKALANTEQFAKYGVTVFDSSGELRNMADIIGDVEGALEGQSDATKKQILLEMGFSDKSVASMMALIGTSDSIREYEEQLRLASGTTEEIAAKQLTSLSAQLKLAKNNLNDVAITIGSKLAPYVRALAGVFQGFGEIASEQGIGAGLKYLGGQFLDLTTNMGTFGNVMLGLISLFVTLRLVSIAATIAQNLFGVSLLANPIGIFVAAVIALGVALVALYLKFEIVRKVINTIALVLKTAFMNVIEAVYNAFAGLYNGFAQGINLLIKGANLFGANIPEIEMLGYRAFTVIGNAAEKANKQIGASKKSIDAYGSRLEALAATYSKVETPPTPPFSPSKTVETAGEKLQKYIDKLKGLTSAQRSYRDSQKGVLKADTDLLEAKTKLADAQAYMNQVLKGFGAGSKQAKDRQKELDKAQRGVERSNYSVEGAVFAVTDAEAELAKLRADPESSAQAIREAEIDLAEAKLSVADATDSQTNATNELATAQLLLQEAISGASESSDTYLEAAKALKDAQMAERDATDQQTAAYERQKDALDALTKAQKEAAEAKTGVKPAAAAAAEAAVNAPVIVGGAPVATAAPVSTGNLLMDSVLNRFTGRARELMLERGGFIQPFAQGGIVTSPMMGMVGEAGSEAIIPLDRLGEFGGQTINIVINAGIGTDASAVGDEIVNVLQRYNRRNGALPLKVA